MEPTLETLGLAGVAVRVPRDKRRETVEESEGGDEPAGVAWEQAVAEEALMAHYPPMLLRACAAG